MQWDGLCGIPYRWFRGALWLPLLNHRTSLRFPWAGTLPWEAPLLISIFPSVAQHRLSCNQSRPSEATVLTTLKEYHLRGPKSGRAPCGKPYFSVGKSVFPAIQSGARRLEALRQATRSALYSPACSWACGWRQEPASGSCCSGPRRIAAAHVAHTRQLSARQFLMRSLICLRLKFSSRACLASSTTSSSEAKRRAIN